MAVTEIYYPSATGADADWTPSTGQAHNCVDDIGSPDTSDYISKSGTGTYRESFTASSGTYITLKMVPWDKWEIKIYAKTTLSTCPIVAYIIYGGTRYYIKSWDGSQWVNQTNTLTTTAGWYTWTLDSSNIAQMWSRTGLTNFGIAASQIEFGIEKNTSSSRSCTIYTMNLQCTHPDHAAATPNSPDTPLSETGQNRLDSVVGTSGNPTYLVPWDFTMTMTHNDATIGGCKIQVGTSEGGSDIWDSGLLQLGMTLAAGTAAGKKYAGSTILQDGVTYYWRMCSVSVYSEDSAWVNGAAVLGVTDKGWWDAAYRSRFNIRFGASHSQLPVGYTNQVGVKTGYGIIVATNGYWNEAVQNSGTSIVEYNGFTYISWIGNRSATPLHAGMSVYVGKINKTTGVSSYYELEITGTIDSHYYGVLLIGADHKLHAWVCGHQSQSTYYRTTGADDPGNGIDISSGHWTSQATPSGLNRSSYLRPMLCSDGTIAVFFRESTADYYPSCLAYVTSTDNGANWSAKKIYVWYYDQILGVASAYCGGVVLDANNRAWVVVSWADGYGASNPARAVSLIYSDYDAVNKVWTTWQELETSNTVGTTHTSLDSTCAHYASCSKIDTCVNAASGPLTAPTCGSNEQALVLDGSGYPHFTYNKPAAGENETAIYHTYWTGSAWTIINLYTETSMKVWRARQGGAIYYDSLQNAIFIYGFAKPTGEYYFGGELYQWKKNMTTGAWSSNYLTSNTGKGCGMFSVLLRPSTDAGKELLFARGGDIVWARDEYLELIKQNGDDVRIVEVYNNAGTVSYSECDRLPDSFQLNPTTLNFANKTIIPSNGLIPANRLYQLYSGKYNATSPLKEDRNIWPFPENFERYASNSDLNGQGGWSGTAGKFMVYDINDTTNYSGGHTMLLWDGANILYANAGTATETYIEKSMNDAYPGLGTGVTDVSIEVSIRIQDIDDGGYLWFEILNAAGTTWFKVGIHQSGSYYASYRRSDGSLTDVELIDYHIWYRFKINVNSSGVSAWVNGVSLVSNSNIMTTFDKIRIGSEGGSFNFPKGQIDGIVISKLVATAPTLTTTSSVEEISYAAGTDRLGSGMVLQFSTSSRLAGAVVPDKLVVARIGGLVFPEKSEITQLAGILTGDKTVLARLMESLTLEQPASDRLSGRSILEQAASARVMEALILEATDKGRLAEAVIIEAAASGRLAELLSVDKNLLSQIAETLILNATGTDRIAGAVTGDKAVLERLAEGIILESAASSRIAELLISDKQLVERLAATLTADKTVITRIAQALAFEASPESRIANFVALEAAVGSRLYHLATLESTAQSRLASALLMDKGSMTRLMQSLALDAPGIARVASSLITDKATSSRLAESISGDKAVVAHLANAVALEVTAKARLAGQVMGDKAMVERLMEMLTLEAGGSMRLAQLAEFETGFTSRLAELLKLEAAGEARLSESLLLEQGLSSRLANALLSDKNYVTRIAGLLLADKAVMGRLAQWLGFEIQVSSRVAGVLLLDKMAIDRIASDIALEMSTTDRLTNAMILNAPGSTRLSEIVSLTMSLTARLAEAVVVEQQSFRRVMHTVIFFVIPQLIKMTRIRMKQAGLENITIAQPTVDRVRMTQAGLSEIQINQPRLDHIQIRSARMLPVEFNQAGEPVWIK